MLTPQQIQDISFEKALIGGYDMDYEEKKKETKKEKKKERIKKKK